MRRKFKEDEINLTSLNNLPGKTISLASAIQYLDLLPIVKKYLESKGKKVIINKGSYYPGQVLGCQSFAFDKNADTLLLLADGKFHARGNSLDLGREIFIFDSRKLEIFSNQEIEKLNERKKKAIDKFIMNPKIGLLISTKKGQFYPKYLEIKEKLEKQGKKVYVFETDSINLQELENFPLNIYINTACPGLSLDSDKIVNLKDVLSFI